MVNTPKFGQEEYGKFVVEFYKGSFPHLRFGQAFFWFFKDQGMSGVTDPSLFYEVDDKVAYQKILAWYIE
jgi:hypothetical protein